MPVHPCEPGRPGSGRRAWSGEDPGPRPRPRRAKQAGPCAPRGRGRARETRAAASGAPASLPSPPLPRGRPGTAEETSAGARGRDGGPAGLTARPLFPRRPGAVPPRVPGASTPGRPSREVGGWAGATGCQKKKNSPSALRPLGPHPPPVNVFRPPTLLSGRSTSLCRGAPPKGGLQRISPSGRTGPRRVV